MSNDHASRSTPNVAARRLVKAARKSLLQVCNKCKFDEAEGALLDHCPACCHRIVGELWEQQFISKDGKAVPR